MPRGCSGVLLSGEPPTARSGHGAVGTMREEQLSALRAGRFRPEREDEEESAHVGMGEGGMTGRRQR